MTVHSFAELAQVMGIKSKDKKPTVETRICPDCGNELRRVQGTNIWVCDWATLEEDKTTKDGKFCSVFTRCGFKEATAV